jgi:hypothetical protein
MSRRDYRDDVIEALADYVFRLELRIVLDEADVEVYRTMAHLAIHHAHELHRELQNVRRREQAARQPQPYCRTRAMTPHLPPATRDH